jgi:hypothetical protein
VSLLPSPSVIFLGDNSKEDGMGGKYDTHGGEEK